MAERLYTQSVDRIKKQRNKFEEEIDFMATHNHPAVPTSSDRSTGEEAMLERLYKQPMEKKRITLEKLERKAEAELYVSKKMSRFDVEAMAERLCAHDAKEQILLKSTRRVYGNPQKPHVLTKPEMDARIDALYTQARQKKKESDEKLREQYMWKKVHSLVISREREKEIAERLSSKQ